MGRKGLMGLMCLDSSHSTLQPERDWGVASPYPVRKNWDVEIPIET
jgi:hypothetical protein